jgi:hypothetical protein
MTDEITGLSPVESDIILRWRAYDVFYDTLYCR